MKVNVENAGPCRKKMHVNVGADDVMPQYDAILKEFSKAAKVPGFRKGKTPVDVTERHYSNDIIQETKDRVVPKSYREALDQNKIKPVAIVEVSDVSFSKEDGVAFDVTFDVAPEFKLPKYKKIVLKSQPVEVGDDQLKEAYDRLLDSSSRFEDVTGRSVKEGDLVMIDYEGSCENEPLAELVPESSGLGSGKDFWALVSEPEIIPGISKELQGMNIGDSKEINVHFADDYHVTAISGKDALYSVAVKGMREKRQPDINEEFLKRFEVESEDALKSKIREDLVKNAERAERERLKDEAAKYLLGKANIDVPQTLVEQETQAAARNMVQRMAMGGASKDQIESQQQDILNAATESSTDRVKISYILDRIADEENISVDDTELDERISTMAAGYGMPVAQFRAEIEKRSSLENVKDDIKSGKTLDFLLDNAKIKK